jgi:hypothetical protein
VGTWGGCLTLKLKYLLEPLTLGSVHRSTARQPALTGGFPLRCYFLDSIFWRVWEAN